MEEKGMEREITPEQTPIEVSTKASEISGDEEEVQEVRLPDLNAAYEEKEREARLKENPEHSQETAQEDTAKQDETVGSKEEGNITDNDVEKHTIETASQNREIIPSSKSEANAKIQMSTKLEIKQELKELPPDELENRASKTELSNSEDLLPPCCQLRVKENLRLKKELQESKAVAESLRNQVASQAYRLFSFQQKEKEKERETEVEVEKEREREIGVEKEGPTSGLYKWKKKGEKDVKSKELKAVQKEVQRLKAFLSENFLSFLVLTSQLLEESIGSASWHKTRDNLYRRILVDREKIAQFVDSGDQDGPKDNKAILVPSANPEAPPVQMLTSSLLLGVRQGKSTGTGTGPQTKVQEVKKKKKKAPPPPYISLSLIIASLPQIKQQQSQVPPQVGPQAATQIQPLLQRAPQELPQLTPQTTSPNKVNPQNPTFSSSLIPHLLPHANRPTLSALPVGETQGKKGSTFRGKRKCPVCNCLIAAASADCNVCGHIFRPSKWNKHRHAAGLGRGVLVALQPRPPGNQFQPNNQFQHPGPPVNHIPPLGTSYQLHQTPHNHLPASASPYQHLGSPVNHVPPPSNAFQLLSPPSSLFQPSTMPPGTLFQPPGSPISQSNQQNQQSLHNLQRLQNLQNQQNHRNHQNHRNQEAENSSQWLSLRPPNSNLHNDEDSQQQQQQQRQHQPDRQP